MKGKLALGAVVGAVAGVVAGVLTAPKGGKETRADIKARAEELKVRTDKTAQNVKKSTEEVASRATGKVQEAVDSAKRTLKK